MPIHDWTKVTPNIFHDFHGSWIQMLQHALNEGVLPKYASRQPTRNKEQSPFDFRTGIFDMNRSPVPTP